MLAIRYTICAISNKDLPHMPSQGKVESYIWDNIILASFLGLCHEMSYTSLVLEEELNDMKDKETIGKTAKCLTWLLLGNMDLFIQNGNGCTVQPTKYAINRLKCDSFCFSSKPLPSLNIDSGYGLHPRVKIQTAINCLFLDSRINN